MAAIGSFNLVRINKTSCELEGPYECPLCGFHMMLDTTYLDQVDLHVYCPNCKQELKVPNEA